jgi:hypothetical protein
VNAVQAAGTTSGYGSTTRRMGYVAAIAVNLVMLYIVNNLLEWGWVPFLTAEFERLVGFINFSLAATIVTNLAWFGYDAEWFRSLAQICLNLITGVVAVRTYQVFPFDFSNYEFAWGPIARFVIIIGLVGIAIGTVVELVKLVRSGVRALA